MIIYPLPPKELDDKTLSKQIKAIAQTLCNAQHLLIDDKNTCHCFEKNCALTFEEHEKVPMKPKGLVDPDAYTNWASECRANYLQLVDMAIELLSEYYFRFSEGCIGNTGAPIHKYDPIIAWALDNVPDLLDTRDCLSCDGTGWGGVSYDPNECLNCKGTGKQKLRQTHFPLAMPDEYIVYKGKSQRYGTYTDEPDIEESYRKYYKSRIECKKCDDGTGYYVFGDETRKCYECDKGINAAWTRRQKPEYLK